MSEVGRPLQKLVLYTLLLALNIFPSAGIIPHSFPTQNLSSIYLLIIYTCLILYYSYRVAHPASLKAIMKILSCMPLFLILLRGIKYSVFMEIDMFARYTWYLYYVPMLFIPLLFFYTSLMVYTNEDKYISRKYYSISLLATVILILLVLTNDFHQQAFQFQPDFIYWNRDYTRGPIYFACVLWGVSLFLVSITILIIRCRVSSSKRNAWLILLPLGIGITLILLHNSSNIIKFNGKNIIEFPEIFCFMIIGILECCIGLGLIPTNERYRKLFRLSSIPARITDRFGNIIYKSDIASPLTKEQLFSTGNTRIDKHSVLYRMKIPGGFGFWQDDVTELDRLNVALAETKSKLSEESELIRLQNELKEKQAKIEQRTIVYNKIARHTRKQSLEIFRIAKEARQSSDKAFKDGCRNHILLLGAYIKRYANLMLLSDESKIIEVGEFAVSVSEILRYLNFCGIPAELINTAEGEIPANAVFTVFEAFRTLLEDNFYSISGIFVNFSVHDVIFFKLTLENIHASVSEAMREMLSSADVNIALEYEDNVTYVCFTLPSRGGLT